MGSLQLQKRKEAIETLDWLLLETDIITKQTNIFIAILKRAVRQHQRNTVKS